MPGFTYFGQSYPGGSGQIVVDATISDGGLVAASEATVELSYTASIVDNGLTASSSIYSNFIPHGYELIYVVDADGNNILDGDGNYVVILQQISYTASIDDRGLVAQSSVSTISSGGGEQHGGGGGGLPWYYPPVQIPPKIQPIHITASVADSGIPCATRVEVNYTPPHYTIEIQDSGLVLRSRAYGQVSYTARIRSVQRAAKSYSTVTMTLPWDAIEDEWLLGIIDDAELMAA